MKKCIWCLEGETKASFNRLAHIFPQSLGGKRTCDLVCDACNSYFGSKQAANLPSIEVALKEPLNISRTYLLSQPFNRTSLPRFKSEYFEYDLKKHIIKPKFKYRLQSDFQSNFVKQFKRGIFKIFLEERSQSRGDAFDERFNFIREFARYGLGDYPVYYFRPTIRAIFLSENDIQNPVVRFTVKSDEDMKRYGHYAYYFITHYLAIPTIRTHELTSREFLQYTLSENIYDLAKPIINMHDLDFIFSFAN